MGAEFVIRKRPNATPVAKCH